MKREDARRLLDQIAVLKRGCDLDLLIFFARHPRSLLASESLAGFLGYELKDVAESLDVLLGAGLLTRTQTPAHAARLYVLAIEGTSGGVPDWLPPLVVLASTREGRLALREALTHRRGEGTGTVASSERREGRNTSGPRRIVATPRPRSATG